MTARAPLVLDPAHEPPPLPNDAALDLEASRNLRELARTEPMLRDLTFQGGIASRSSVIEDAGMNWIGTFNPSSVSNHLKRKMRRDPVIRLALAAAKAPLSSASWHVECQDREVKAIAEKVLLEPWISRYLNHGSRSIDFGHQVDEILWERRDVDFLFEDESGEESEGTFSGYLPRGFRDLDPDSFRYLHDRATGETVGISQRVAGFQDAPEIVPLEKLLHFTHSSEWGNPYGEGRLDWVYDVWYWAVVVHLFCNRYYERRAVPTMLAWVGRQTVRDPDTGTSAKEPLGAIAAALQAQIKNQSVIALPNNLDSLGKMRMWDIKTLEAPERGEQFISYLNYLAAQKFRGVLVPEKSVTQDGKVGSLAMAKEHGGVRVTLANSTLDMIEEALNSSLVPEWVRANSIDEEVRIVHGGVSPEVTELQTKVLEIIGELDVIRLKGEDFGDSSALLSELVDVTRLLATGNVPTREPAEKGKGEREGRIEVQGPQGGAVADPKTGEEPGGEAAGKSTPPKKVAASLELARAAVVEPAAGSPKVARLTLEDLRRDFDQDMIEAEGAIQAHTRPQRDVIDEREKAALAILFWLLLRAKKTAPDGTKIAGSREFDSLVMNASGKMRPVATLATNLPSLQSAAGTLSGSGLRLASEGNAGLLKKFNKMVRDLIGVKPLTAAINAVAGIEAGVASLASLAKEHFVRGGDKGGWGIPQRVIDLVRPGYPIPRPPPGTLPGTLPLPSEPPIPGEAAFRKRSKKIVDINAAGIARNIENIVLRVIQGILETITNAFATLRLLETVGEGEGIALGIYDDVADWRLNRRNTDLTLEAHLRAGYRAAMLQLSEESGLSCFLGIHPPGAPEETGPRGGETLCRSLDGSIATASWWNEKGAAGNAPMPIEMFGLGWGCRIYFYPIPEATIIRESLPVEG